VRALVVLLLLARTAAAEERELCTRGAVFRGPAIDLDVKGADIHDVYRLLSDVGRVNIVISGDVRAKVTLRLKRVAWQHVACAIAGVHKLQILVNGNVLLVRAAGSR
jgi:type II secretory pathway component HofQ